MALNQVRTSKETIRATLPFQRPIFAWSSFAVAWVNGVFDKLGKVVRVQTSDFESAAPNNFGGTFVAYRLFGGHHRVTVYPDRMEIDFPNLITTDAPLVAEILTVFHDLIFAVDGVSIPHLQVSNLALLDCQGFSATEHLKRFSLPSVEKSLNPIAAYQPSVRFSCVSDLEGWHGLVTLEKSNNDANGLYLSMDLTLLALERHKSYPEKATALNKAITAVTAAVGLVINDA